MSFSRAINSVIAAVTDNSDSEDNSFKKTLILAITFLIGISLIKYLQPKNQDFKKSRDQDGFTREDRIKQEKLWNTYALTKLLGVENLANQTQLFFDAIGKERTKKFESSTTQIIQFGISTGDYLTKMTKKQHRKVIGYDYSSLALDSLKEEKNVETRLINLNAVDANNNLTYQTQLEKDFSVVSDVLLIRVLEYLNPEAVQLLIISMMDLAKPGSRFYCETLSPLSDLTDSSGQITISYSLKPGMISSFFAKRNDFKIEVLDNTKNPSDRGNETLERLLIEKVGLKI